MILIFLSLISLISFNNFKDNYRAISIDLNKKTSTYWWSKRKKKLESLDRVGSTTISFIYDEVKETIFIFSKITVTIW